MSNRLNWDRDGRYWPNRASSRFVQAAHMRWHVQIMGDGPAIFLLHGTGASTHSWGRLAPLLAEHFTVVAPDLPGHGFNSAVASNRLSLPGMARSLNRLLGTLEIEPALAVGHSAGAAISVRMCLEGYIAPRALVSLNGAFLPFDGLAGHLFPTMAKLLFLNPLAPRVFAWGASDRSRIEKLIKETGSAIDGTGVDLYQRLFRDRRHVAGALGMMANWNLDALNHDLSKLTAPLTLVVGTADKTVPPSTADEVRKVLPTATVDTLPGLGHLAHEESPEAVAEIILRAAREAELLPAN